MVKNFHNVSCLSLVRVWFNCPHFWVMLSDLLTGAERPCKDLGRLDLSAGAGEGPTTVNMVEVRPRLGVQMLEG